MSNFFFNFFASIIIISVFMTISVNNAVYAVLFLILAFFSTMCILFLLNIDYLALMFILIYVGAITILFLFVVMMLKIKLNEKEQRRKEEISDIAKKWYYLSGDERKDILDINNVTNYEQSVIEKLSQNITKYKNIINARGNKKMEGVSFNEE